MSKAVELKESPPLVLNSLREPVRPTTYKKGSHPVVEPWACCPLCVHVRTFPVVADRRGRFAGIDGPSRELSVI